jgi:hypothetical protein
MDVGQLVALPAGARDVGERQLGDCFAARLALGHRLARSGDELAQLGVLVAVFGIEQRAREHARRWRRQEVRFRVAGAGAGVGCRARKMRRMPG